MIYGLCHSVFCLSLALSLSLCLLALSVAAVVTAVIQWERLCTVALDQNVSQKDSIIIIFFTPWSRVLWQKVTGFQQVKKFPIFYGIPSFITAFTSASHLSLCRARSSQYIHHNPLPKDPSEHYPHLRLVLLSCLFPKGFPTRILYTSLLSPMRATCPTHLNFLDLVTRKILGE